MLQQMSFNQTDVFIVDIFSSFFIFFFLQSTINPVDGIYQPPLETPVVNTTMPTQTTLPSGTAVSFTVHLPELLFLLCNLPKDDNSSPYCQIHRTVIVAKKNILKYI